MILLLFCMFDVSLVLIGAKQSEEEKRVFSGQWIESVTVSRELQKRGFHRELEFSVQCGSGFPRDLHALLVQKLPSGVYVDPYQLASLNQGAGLQVLLDSEVDLEAPAYLSPGFSALVFPARDPGGVGRLWASVPIHGRYHRPSDSGLLWVHVDIEPPRLLLRADSRERSPASLLYKLVEAPCTAHNLSVCDWLEIQPRQDQRTISLEIPVGDGSLTMPVCAGTMLVTLLCCGILGGAVWRHGL